LPAPEGTRQLVLFIYAEGTPLSPVDEYHSYLAGKVAATVHAASTGFSSPHPRRQLNLDCLVDRPLAAAQPFFAHRPQDWEYLTETAAKLRARVEAEASRGLDWGVCHGDLSAKNMHVGDDGAPTVFDFDLCGPGWRAYDFAAVLWAAHFKTDEPVFDAFVQGYADTRQVSPHDLAAVPLFYALSHLFYLGLHASNVDYWGKSVMGDNYLDIELRFFREWEAEHMAGS
jgi:Ser/Thr protein kinase RdoA (MazF antagonist)